MILLLLTKFYPYGTGEAFIENEIEVASRHYEEVVIIACEVSEKDNNMRKVPENVRVYKVSSKKKRLQMLQDTLKGIFCNRSSLDYVSYISEYRLTKKLSHKMFLKYFEAKCNRIAKTIIDNDYLEDIAGEQYVLYSYWLFATARIGDIIANVHMPSYMLSRAHRYDLYVENNMLGYLPYRRRLLNRYDDVLPCSENGARYLIDKYPEYMDKIHSSLLGTVNHGIENWSRNDTFTIVSCSRLEPLKRVDRIYESLLYLANNGYHIKWIHIGDGSVYNNLKKKVESAPDNLECRLLGNMKNADVMEYYSNNSIDLFVNASNSEGLPVSIMEAISFGIPCIATDVGGTSEIVCDKTGILIRADFSNGELADAIQDYIDKYESDSYEEARKKCRQYWEEHFVAINNYNKFYEDIRSKYEEV